MEAVYNWHVTERCQYSCKYCFAKWGDTKEIWQNVNLTSALLDQIRIHGREPFGEGYETAPIRLNFAGGEPLLLKQRLIDIAKESKSLGFQTSLITNGERLGQSLELISDLDMIGLSIDSFDEATNRAIGRIRSSGKALSFQDIYDLVTKARTINPEILVKFNVVVNKYNYHEELIPKLLSLSPQKIKVLQELSAGGNVSSTNDEMFSHFISNNQCDCSNVYIEDRNSMFQSYLMINPSGRFYQNSNTSHYLYSAPIHEVGLLCAMKSISFNQQQFSNRYNGAKK
nr:viperin family antiviral radical SAM protein [uncultured Tolumonas sp.]